MTFRPILQLARAQALGPHTRRLATSSEASSSANLSRFEPNNTIDYADLVRKIEASRNILRRPLSYAEKILFAHADNLGEERFVRGKTQLKLRPRRIACQDATAQMAIIQFMSAGLDSTAVPTTIHCDHLIVSKDGEEKDLPNALGMHSEVYDFMSSAAKRFNMGFWKPGAGIIHQTVLENYAFPGGLMVGTDSHTPNAGGMGMVAIGVGGADAVDVMAGLHFELTAPGIIGIRLSGKLSGWATPKDIINHLAGILTVKGGTGSILEFFGPGTETLSATGMATVTNMGAETGATTSIFPFSEAMGRYLEATNRHDIAQAVRFASHELRADEQVEYDRVVEIDLSSLEPRINGPFTPDLSTPMSKFAETALHESWPRNLTAGLIGSCTNSSFEDMTKAAAVAKQALDAGLRPKMPLLLSPGSEQTRQTLQDSDDLAFDPTKDSLVTPGGKEFKFQPPIGDSLPSNGYANTDHVYTSPPSRGREGVEIKISNTSERLQRLAPFPRWPGSDPENCVILIKAKGKCTTDHITPAGPWFRYRGHLENISNNTLIGAVNAENGKANSVRNWLTGEEGDVPGTAKRYRELSQPWVVIGDHNYGEGSSREHAALQPRYLGCVAIIAKSFARIHETNLKKQGLLALKFAREDDYDRIQSSARISIIGLKDVAVGKNLILRVTSTADSNTWDTQVSHTMTQEQIQYFKSGSALNLMAERKNGGQIGTGN
ncbi:aconitate hydratase [Ilyonectria robusta]